MKITLHTSASLSVVRRLFRGSGYGLTLRHGSIYIFVNQPTELLRVTRSLFAEAHKLAYAEMSDPKRRLFWQEVAMRLGYKTARGAAHAHFIKLLRQRKQTSSSRVAASASQTFKCALRTTDMLPFSLILNTTSCGKPIITNPFSRQLHLVFIRSSA